MLRRFVLVGLLVLAQGSIMQIIMGTLLAAAFLLFQVLLAYLRAHSANGKRLS